MLTSIKVCTNRQVSKIVGVQVSYGKFEANGEIFGAVSLNPIGNVDHATSVCTIFYIPRGDYLASAVLKHSIMGVHQIWLTTNQGKTASYGSDSEEGSETIPMQFSDTTYLFFGFLGLERTDNIGEMSAIGIIRYDVQCLIDERRYQGSNFVWFAQPPKEL